MNTLMSNLNEDHNDRVRQQRKGVLITCGSILLVVCMFMGLFLNKILSPRILSHAELRINGAIVFESPRIIKPFQLQDHTGSAFTLDRLTGKWSLLFFGFTHCPDICPTGLAKLSQVMSHLDSDIREQVQVIMVSLDPARDTPEKLANYVPFFNEAFVGVSGSFQETMSLTQNLNVAFSKVMLDDDYTIDHSSHIVLVNPLGHYHGFFKPPFELAKLKTTLSSIVYQTTFE